MTFPKFSRKSSVRHATVRQPGETRRKEPKTPSHAMRKKPICRTDSDQAPADLCDNPRSVAREKRPETAENSGKPVTVALSHVARLGFEKNETTDWRDFYDERAAIAQFDGGLSRPDAEAQAWECCLSSWLNTNPSPETSDGVCAQCGGHLGDFNCIPIARPDAGATWLHAPCHAPWMKSRRRQAGRALRRMGVAP